MVADGTPCGRITINPKQLGGQACVRGLRIPVATVVRCVASGMTSAEILEAYPDLELADITASLYYAASMIEDRYLSASLPKL